MPVSASSGFPGPGGSGGFASPLAWLLAPVTVTTFLDELWGAAPHHIARGRSDYFDRLAGPAVAEQIPAALRTDPSAVRLVRGPDHLQPEQYTLADGTVDLARVRAELDNGYTIICNNIEKYLRPFSTLTHGVEVELNFPTHVNAYITPPGSTGFLPHYDHHDVLVLQIQGDKTWYFYGDEPVPPHLMQQMHEVDPAGLPEPTSLRLAAGDTLYLPRGRVHSAETTAQSSIHLTVGIHVPTVLTLLTHTLHMLSLRDDVVHTRLPARHLDDPGVRAELGALIQDGLTAIADPDSLAEGLGAMQDFLVRRARCPVVGQVSETVGIDVDTVVRKQQPLYSRVTATADGVGLQFAQLIVSARPDHETAMRFLSERTESFRVGELPGLTAPQQIELTRSLIMSGFLVRPPGQLSIEAVASDT
ncbi:cupin domain-containing protein [[Mycobacterium] nativiensis]|uniref:Cupin domain-containing protein n=1 Tax=[Mycobacterium] nativiensis TaxID=2855503 RepID=A0ABU5XXJ9_9MYCO|nr:cupin domain-containing protein [Mycolicibacter sp. MYC340]MEB3032512.1 cupin domain-containing protein [Mycolicibacter sp. MYC340]